MKKNFLINFLLLFVVNLLVKPAWIFTDLMAQRETGLEYGNYFVLFNLSMLFNILLDLGISNFNNRKVAANEAKFQNYFIRLFTLRLSLALLYLAAIAVVGMVLDYEGAAFQLLFLLGFNQVLVAFITYFRSNLTALGLFKWDSLISVLDRIIMISLILILLFVHQANLTIELFVQVQFAGYATGALIALVLLLSKKASIRINWSWKFNKTLLRKSYPYALIVILMSGYSYADSIMLKELRPDGIYQNTIYAQSFRLLMAVNNYTYLIAVLLLPLFAKMIKERKEVQTLLRLSGTLLIYGTVMLSLLMMFFSTEIIQLLYGQFGEGMGLMARFNEGHFSVKNLEEVTYSTQVFQVLIFVSIPMSFNYIYGALLTAGGKMNVLNTIAGIGLAGNLVLNFILIPSFGALGAAYASIATQGFCAIGQAYCAYKEHQIKFPVVHFLKFTGMAATLLVVHFMIHSKIQFFSELVLLGVIALLGLAWFSIVTPSNLKRHLFNK